MSKTYNYKSLIDIYVSIPNQDWIHEDFRIYREGLVAKLEELLSIDISKKPDSRRFNQEIFHGDPVYTDAIWQMFEETVNNLRKDSGVFGAYLLGSPRITLIEIREKNPTEVLNQVMKTTSKLYELDETVNKTRYELLYQLVELIYGKIDIEVTSEELLAIGFDDSKEPQFKDYHKYL